MSFMLTMYVKTGCPYCEMTEEKVQELGLVIDYKNIADDGVVEELIARGGKRQVPYLVDSDNGIEMYESEHIMEYLENHYAKKA